MLTKDEVNQIASMVLSVLSGRAIRGVHDAVLKLNKQAMQAITLTEENARLKAKLDAVKTVCKMRQYGLMDSEFDYGLAQIADEIMAIIGKDGDE